MFYVQQILLHKNIICLSTAWTSLIWTTVIYKLIVEVIIIIYIIVVIIFNSYFSGFIFIFWCSHLASSIQDYISYAILRVLSLY